MQFGKVIFCTVLATGLFLAGCSEPAEQAAAKKISSMVARARELMEDPSTVSYGRAQNLLQQALAVPGATDISKRTAHELLGTLLSELTVRQANGLTELRTDLAQADAVLQNSLSELSTAASTLAYAVALGDSDTQALEQYQRQLRDRISHAKQAVDAAVTVTVERESKLAATQKEGFAAAAKADAMLLALDRASGDEYVRQMNAAAAKRLQADGLLITASQEELILTRAKEDEIRAKSELALLQEALKNVEQLIRSGQILAGRANLAKDSAQAKAEKSAGKVLASLNLFSKSVSKLLQGDKALALKGYEELIKQQSQAIANYRWALSAAATLRQRFVKFKTSRPSDAKDDELVEALTPLDNEVSLAISLARAQIALSALRQQKAGILERLAYRAKQVEQVRRELAAVGAADGTKAAHESMGVQEPRGFLARMFTGAEKSHKQDKVLSVVAVPMAPGSVDIAAVEQGIQEAHQASLKDLNSAVDVLWSTALPRTREPGSAEEMVKKLQRDKWNWQVWSMLAFAHQARSTLEVRMGREEQAGADDKAAATYLAQSKSAQAKAIEPGKSN